MLMVTDPGLRPLALALIVAGCGVVVALLISVATDPGRQVVASGAREAEWAPPLREANHIGGLGAWPE